MRKSYALCILLLLWGISVQMVFSQSFSGGSGTESDPYKITKVTDLQLLSEKLESGETYSGVYFRMENDIDMYKAPNFGPIGGLGGMHPFGGVFDGDNFKVLNYHYDIMVGNEDRKVGLFGQLSSTGVIKNLGVVDAYVSHAYMYSGILCAYNEGTIEDSYVTGELIANYNYGGLVGYNKGTIRRSYAKAIVRSQPAFSGTAGVLVGENEGLIEDSYAIGEADAMSRAGVLVAWNYKSGIIRNSYAVGVVYTRDVGKSYFVDYNQGTITNSYYCLKTTVSSMTAVANLGVVIKDEEDLKTVDFITDLNADRELPQPWRMDLNENINSGYPILLWQSGLPSIVTLDVVDFTFATAKLRGIALEYADPIVEEGFQYKLFDDENWISKSVVAVNDTLELVIDNLTENKLYEFRAYAQTQDSLIYGDSKTFTTVSTSIEVENLNNKIIIYPNLVKDVVSVTIPNMEGRTPISILNMSGKVVARYTMDQGKADIDVEFLPQGIYILQAENLSTKLIKK